MVDDLDTADTLRLVFAIGRPPLFVQPSRICDPDPRYPPFALSMGDKRSAEKMDGEEPQGDLLREGLALGSA